VPLADPAVCAAREIAAIEPNLKGRTPAELLAAPRMRAPEQLACMDLLSTFSDATYFHRPDLWPFVTARLVNTSLQHGNAVSSPQAYGGYAVMLGAITRIISGPTLSVFSAWTWPRGSVIRFESSRCWRCSPAA
jgi:predicted ATPase